MRISTANAKEMSALSAAVRKQRKEAAQSITALAVDPPPLSEGGADDFVETSLARARTQITLLSNRLTIELQNPKADPMAIDRLTRSLASLEETERRLSGRSLPPTVKAMPPKRERERPSIVEPS